MRSRLAPAFLVLAMLGACSPHGDQSGAVTADEARQLNDAAEMLDANSVDENAVAPDTNESDPS